MNEDDVSFFSGHADPQKHIGQVLCSANAVGRGVVMPVGVASMQLNQPTAAPGLVVEVLGPVAVVRNGVRVDLPRSRKTRGLLAFLALSARSVGREELCALLWDGTSDPKSELRWSLAKIKGAVGPWLRVSDGCVGLVREGLSVDALAFRSQAQQV